MVHLTRIYTRGGDAGETSLADGSRVPKDDLRVAAYGAVDEANAAIGLCRLVTGTGFDGAGADRMLARIQNDLFDLGADLATPEPPPGADAGPALRIVPAQVLRLEQEIDAMNVDLSPLKSFILPGGNSLAAHLHVARTITRRAERVAVALAQRTGINPEAVKYLNRLSDHLFVLGRRANHQGADDVLWVPGAHR